MSSLGINVGKTGGSLLAEAMIATRGISRAVNHFNGGGGSISHNKNSNSEVAGALSGGLTGVVGRHFSQSAAGSVTGKSDNMVSSFARSVYENSVAEGGNFANNVISSVAHGEIAQNGSIKGQEASKAFCSYMGVKSNNTGDNTKSDKLDANSNTVDTLHKSELKQNTSLDIPITQSMNTSSIGYENQNSQDINLAQDSSINEQQSLNNDITMDKNTNHSGLNPSSFQNTSDINSTLNNMIQSSNTLAPELQQNQNAISSSQIENTGSERISMVETVQSSSVEDTPLSPSTDWISNSPAISETMAAYSDMNVSESSLSTEADTTEIHTGDQSDYTTIHSGQSILTENCGIESTQDSISIQQDHSIETPMQGSIDMNNVGERESVIDNQAFYSNTAQTESMPQHIEPLEKSYNVESQFTSMEIGGGKITGVETSPNYPNGIQFAMYSVDKYMSPENNFSIVKAVDGTKWYHQYAKNVVEKTPFMKSDGKISYDESLVKKLPPAPKRKDRI